MNNASKPPPDGRALSEKNNEIRYKIMTFDKQGLANESRRYEFGRIIEKIEHDMMGYR